MNQSSIIFSSFMATVLASASTLKDEVALRRTQCRCHVASVAVAAAMMMNTQSLLGIGSQTESRIARSRLHPPSAEQCGGVRGYHEPE